MAMGLIRKMIPVAFPLSRAGVALWAWRHRDEVTGWAGYAARSVPRLVEGRTGDVLAEGRLRARLSSNRMTRNADGLRVEVDGGVATLRGAVAPDERDAALAIATNISGVSRVRDEMEETGRRRSR